MMTYTGNIIASETSGNANSSVSMVLFAFDDVSKDLACRTSEYYLAEGATNRTLTRAWARNRAVQVDIEDGFIHSARLV